MNKTELKKLIAERNEITQVEAEKYINAFIDGVGEALRQDNKVQIQGFMNFEIKDTKPSSGVINGIEWEKPAGKKVSTKISKAFESEIVGE